MCSVECLNGRTRGERVATMHELKLSIAATTALLSASLMPGADGRPSFPSRMSPSLSKLSYSRSLPLSAMDRKQSSMADLHQPLAAVPRVQLWQRIALELRGLPWPSSTHSPLVPPPVEIQTGFPLSLYKRREEEGPRFRI